MSKLSTVVHFYDQRRSKAHWVAKHARKVWSYKPQQLWWLGGFHTSCLVCSFLLKHTTTVSFTVTTSFCQLFYCAIIDTLCLPTANPLRSWELAYPQRSTKSWHHLENVHPPILPSLNKLLRNHISSQVKEWEFSVKGLNSFLFAIRSDIKFKTLSDISHLFAYKIQQAVLIEGIASKAKLIDSCILSLLFV